MADPLPLCYLDGACLPLKEARISPLDRGFLYADGVYEVMAVAGGGPVDEGPHLTRSARSLSELRIAAPLAEPALGGPVAPFDCFEVRIVQ